MNLILIFASFMALLLSAGNAVPVVLSDASHVNGNRRYIWMSGDDGTNQLVDVQEPIPIDVSSLHETGNQYWLFSRSNPTSPQRIELGRRNSITNSNYAANKPLNVVVHGWNGSLRSELNTLITSALLAAGDVNVIVVDWSTLANAEYVSASANTPRVGQEVGEFVVWLINTTGSRWDNLHLIGFSLGAHAVGRAGVVANGRPRRVTGLDPAGPGWQGNTHSISTNAGRYVELMHTDAGAMGLLLPKGHVSFYPNGGRNQPSCDTNQCSHSRAWALFASSVRTNHFISYRCNDVNQALSNQCRGDQARMGNSILNKLGTGIFGLRTLGSWPF